MRIKQKTLLIVEDDPGLQSQLKWCFEDVDVHLADNETNALEILNTVQPQVVTLDLGLPPDPGGVSVGFIILKHIVSHLPHTKVIIVTGQEDREHALSAISDGAYDFFNKPVDPKILTLVVERAFHLYRLEEENRMLFKSQQSSPLDGVIAASESMMKVCKLAERIAPSDLSVLILGESGTGKEVLAKALHDLSGHSEGDLVAINCAAIPDSLLESELFGHEKGSFTGATSRKLGKIELANNGTLFLDEIGDMPLELQAKLLRFLQERVIERVGGTKTIAINTRVICATHRNIEDMIKQNTFREDLFYRVGDVTLELPPLRERDEDILLLAKYFLHKYKPQNSLIKGLSPSTEQCLLSYEFKGNVRELEKIIRRAVIMCEEAYIQPQDLNIRSENPLINHDEIKDTFALKPQRDANDIKIITRALNEAEWNVSKAAKLLELSRPTLYSMIEKLNIKIQSVDEFQSS